MPPVFSQQPATRTSNQLLLDHPDAYFRLDVGVQANRHAIDAERLDRLVQVDLAMLDVEALRLELRAMSAAVTEPNSLPSSPTRAEKVSDTCSSFSAMRSAPRRAARSRRPRVGRAPA